MSIKDISRQRTVGPYHVKKWKNLRKKEDFICQKIKHKESNGNNI